MAVQHIPADAVPVSGLLLRAWLLRRGKAGITGFSRRTRAADYETRALVGVCDLARILSVSRWTVNRWKRQGYIFSHGRRTSVEHCKTWLKNNSVLLGRVANGAEIEAKIKSLKASASGLVRGRR